MLRTINRAYNCIYRCPKKVKNIVYITPTGAAACVRTFKHREHGYAYGERTLLSAIFEGRVTCAMLSVFTATWCRHVHWPRRPFFLFTLHKTLVLRHVGCTYCCTQR